MRWSKPTTASSAGRIAPPCAPGEAQLGNETTAVREALRSFADLGSALIGARDTGAALDAVIATRPGWEGLGDLVATAAALANTVASDPLNHVLAGYSCFRRYTPRMLDIEAGSPEEVEILHHPRSASSPLRTGGFPGPGPHPCPLISKLLIG